MSDYLPKKDSELVLWSANFAAQIELYASKWGIDADTVTALKAAAAAFAAAVAITDSAERNKINVAGKNAKGKTLVALIRALVSFQLKNPVITDEQRIQLGLHVHDTKPTPIPVPTDAPTLVVKTHKSRHLSIEYMIADDDKKARPYGVNGAVLVYGLLDAPPADQKDLPRNVLITRVPYILEFLEAERGKTVYLAICWQNERGQKGPWSDIQSTLVP